MSSWGQIAVILYTDRVWLQRLHGIASSRRTNASSKDFLVQTVSGSCGDAIVRHTAYVRLAVSATCCTRQVWSGPQELRGGHEVCPRTNSGMAAEMSGLHPML